MFKGFQIKIDDTTQTSKLSQLADDTTLFFNSKPKISVILSVEWNTLRSKAYRNKTEGLRLGNLKSLTDRVENIRLPQVAIKVCEIYFGLDINEYKN